MSNKPRKLLSLKQKVEIIKELEVNSSQSTLVKRGVASKSVISRIWNKRTEILLAYASRPSKTKKIKTAINSELDSRLLTWFGCQREQNHNISTSILTQKANEIAMLLNIENFTCTHGWITRFKNRNSISIGKICGESNSVDLITVQNWIDSIWPTIRCEYEDKDIFNGDETGLYYKCLPNKTLRFKGEKCNDGKFSKERISVWCCASLLGEKRKLLVIGKSQNPRCFKNQNLFGFKYVANKKAWMTSLIWKNELLQWDSELRKIKRKIILLVDNCSAHPDINNQLSNIKIIFLPPNTTSVLQPMDQGIIRNFKFYYKNELISNTIRAIDLKETFDITILTALKIAERSWGKVKIATIKNCFAHSGLSNVLKAEIANVEEIKNEMLEVVGGMFKSRHDIEEYFEIDCSIQARETTVQSNENEESEETTVETLPNKTELNDAIDSMKKVISFYEYQSQDADVIKILTKVYDVESDLNHRYLSQRKVQKTLDCYNFKKMEK